MVVKDVEIVVKREENILRERISSLLNGKKGQKTVKREDFFCLRERIKIGRFWPYIAIFAIFHPLSYELRERTFFGHFLAIFAIFWRKKVLSLKPFSLSLK